MARSCPGSRGAASAAAKPPQQARPSAHLRVVPVAQRLPKGVELCKVALLHVEGGKVAAAAVPHLPLHLQVEPWVGGCTTGGWVSGSGMQFSHTQEVHTLSSRPQCNGSSRPGAPQLLRFIPSSTHPPWPAASTHYEPTAPTNAELAGRTSNRRTSARSVGMKGCALWNTSDMAAAAGQARHGRAGEGVHVKGEGHTGREVVQA